MTLLECKYRRYSTHNSVMQLHCFLKKKDCTEKECMKCPCIISQESFECLQLRHDGTWTTNDLSRGFGDTIAKITSTLGIKGNCNGCKKRQKFLNKMIPYNKMKFNSDTSEITEINP